LATHRLFFAVTPPPPERQRLAKAAERLAAAQRAPGKPTPTAHLHLTLAFLGEFADDEPVARARAAADRVVAAPFPLRIDQAGSFGPNWFLSNATPAPELLALQARLVAELAQCGFTLESRPFVPHITFQRKAEHALPPSRIAPIRWLVEEFALFDSLPNERRYLRLAQWALRG
jgi:2'-5' RNA ligase